MIRSSTGVARGSSNRSERTRYLVSDRSLGRLEKTRYLIEEILIG